MGWTTRYQRHLQVLNIVKCRVSFCTCGRAPPLVVDNQVSDEIRSVPATVPPAYLLNFAIIIIQQCNCTCRFNFFIMIMTTTIIMNLVSGLRDTFCSIVFLIISTNFAVQNNFLVFLFLGGDISNLNLMWRLLQKEASTGPHIISAVKFQSQRRHPENWVKF